MKIALTDFVTSQIRTYVPLGVAVIVNFLAEAGLILPEETSVALVTFLSGLAGALWYIVVRLAEEHVSPKFGWLLGVAKAPEYAKQAEG